MRMVACLTSAQSVSETVSGERALRHRCRTAVFLEASTFAQAMACHCRSFFASVSQVGVPGTVTLLGNVSFSSRVTSLAAGIAGHLEH